ncbi:hypothetical protein [Rhodoplanes elegans]|uniref:hypothetical protein n=1 Tax=Rhodoplanes elegans TaxID=29408 RepID=UPI0019147389|nr:hypothetical protein [Rhodoplanes elegans]
MPWATARRFGPDQSHVDPNTSAVDTVEYAYLEGNEGAYVTNTAAPTINIPNTLTGRQPEPNAARPAGEEFTCKGKGIGQAAIPVDLGRPRLFLYPPRRWEAGKWRMYRGRLFIELWAHIDLR